MKTTAATVVIALLLAVRPAASQTPPAAHVGSTPTTVVRGWISANLPPISTVKQGQTVVIDTLSYQGMGAATGPVDFFSKGGIKSEEVLKDAVEVYAKVPPAVGAGGHILTGPSTLKERNPATSWKFE